MSRRWVYRDDGKGGVEVLEVDADYSDAPRTTGDLGKFAYDNLRAPDGTPIDTPKKHREYLKANGLAMNSDFTEHHAKIQAEREKIFTPGAGFDSKQRKQDIARAMYQAIQRKKRG